MKSALVASIVLSVLAGASMRVAQATIVRATVVTALDVIKPPHRHELCRCPSDASIGLPICQPQLIPERCS
jgi:hypothetical protein